MIPPSDWAGRDLLDHRARITPDTTAFVDGEAGERWTFRSFSQYVDLIRSGLVNDIDGRVGILIDTRPEFAGVLFATIREQSCSVCLNRRETSEELSQKVEQADIETIICESDTESKALDCFDGPVYSVDEPGHSSVEPVFPSETSISTRSFPDSNHPSFDPNRTALVCFTSGTSGTPKGVRLSVTNLLANATASAFRLGVDPNDRWLCCLPLHHMGGLAPVIRSTLYGTTTVFQRRFDPEETAQLAREYDVTGLSLVPTMLDRLLDRNWSTPDSLRFVLLGGAPASQTLLDRADRSDIPVFPTYGMTETASQIATATPTDRQNRPGTVGQPLSCFEVAIVDEAGRTVDSGQTGEIVVRGPAVSSGYIDTDQTNDAYDDRGFHTGDVGYRSADGYLWIQGRRSDRIVTGGENVDPTEVEASLCSHSGVETATVVGIPDPEWGEIVGAVVVPADQCDSLDREAILAHCDDHLAGFKQPKHLHIRTELPRTRSGTVDRAAVRELLQRSSETSADGDNR